MRGVNICSASRLTAPKPQPVTSSRSFSRNISTFWHSQRPCPVKQRSRSTTARFFQTSSSPRQTFSPDCASSAREPSSTSSESHNISQSQPSTPKQPSKVIFSGIQPTGVPHLGNYLGALRQWVKLQNEAAEEPDTAVLYSIVDLHAITIRQDPAQLRQWKRESLATLLAVGLDPDKSMLFYQSNVSAHSELMWILCCTASMGYLSRMTQWKSKLNLPEDASPIAELTKSKLKAGLFSYPVLQAADVLVHGATHVPVGEDQAQHLEFSRTCAVNFNAAYGKVLRQPTTIISPARRVMSLRQPHLKMSKSHEDPRSRIILTDSANDIHAKIRAAVTDSIEGVSYDPSARPGVSNLIELMSHSLDGKHSCEELATDCESLSMRAFKERVADCIIEHLQPIREKYHDVLNADGGRYLQETALKGAERARQNAAVTMTRVREAVGLD
ncbi:tryptophanyl-tRNA synthetase [Xylona heveae TC161]|uniref:Tryptophan--tRNA ligase, mitochondrial n=1 Tax=Xylona heveae (strain CBS 132557 / TC161) TaxID=1328760 RepID=A0A165FP04_XYLHT|nr:tryptophanyl-tRNA synthetase [Xylona heveae TC161]KZF21209.1 tryptophanyl-tRNA synthetase [Xylona heveae TC161]